MLPFDLHVLGLPPAFTLSQDQTLHLKLHCPKAKTFSCRARSQALRIACISTIDKMLMNRTSARWTASPSCRRPHKSPAHTFKELEVGLSAFLRNPVVSVEVSRLLWRTFSFRQHLFSKSLAIRFPSSGALPVRQGPVRRGRESMAGSVSFGKGCGRNFSRPADRPSGSHDLLSPLPDGHARNCACLPAGRPRNPASAEGRRLRPLRLPP